MCPICYSTCLCCSRSISYSLIKPFNAQSRFCLEILFLLDHHLSFFFDGRDRLNQLTRISTYTHLNLSLSGSIKNMSSAPGQSSFWSAVYKEIHSIQLRSIWTNRKRRLTLEDKVLVIK